MKTARHLIIIVLGIAFFLAGSAAFCQYGTERITSFHSDITVHEDSSMTVQETIEVISEGDKIKHGIYRDFPTRYTDIWGNVRTVGFNVVSVLRDGRPEPYHLKEQGNGVLVYFGDANVFLPDGKHTYVLKYDTDRQLGFFRDHDELYWNVTGNGWDFDILETSATVYLPTGVPSTEIKLEGYTGKKGSKAQDYTASLDNGGRPTFRTSAELAPKEGLTIVVSWPKGFIKQPPAVPLSERIMSNTLLLPFVLLIGLLAYYLVAWNIVGRDPRKGTLVVQYSPPEDLSPAAVRYLMRMGYDNRTFAAALINMAVKRYLTIAEKDGEYSITRAEADPSVLSPEELEIAGVLLKSKNSFDFVNKHHSKVSKAVQAVKESLEKRYQKKYFTTNSKWLVPGIVIAAVIIVTGILSAPGEKKELALFMTAWLSIWTVAVSALVYQIINAWRNVSRGTFTKKTAASGMSAGCLTLFALPFIAGEIFGLFMLAMSTPPLFIPILLAAVVINFIFYHLLKSATPEGRRVLDLIEGFRMYLSATDKDRLATVVPTRSPELFERYLPYAIAMGVEQPWSEQFSDVLVKAGEEEEEYHPGWYAGTGWRGMAAGGFASSIGGAIAGSISSASTAPGSSSGSGGGGSSGGGGGGGGGGGW